MNSSTLTPEIWFHRLGTHYVVAQIYFHLNQLGVIQLLNERKAATASEIAQALDLKADMLDCLLSYLVAVDEVLATEDGKRYTFSDFGRAVLDRFQRKEGDQVQFNLWDLRVGSYGPVWSQIGPLLSGQAVYGKDVKRDGRFAEAGLYKLSHRLIPVLKDALNSLSTKAVVEFGSNTGIAERLSAEAPAGQKICVLDRNPEALKEADERLKETGSGGEVDWICSDLFDPSKWLPQVGRADHITFVSIHFHEFIAKSQKVAELISYLKKNTRESYFAVLEQPRVPASEKGKMAEGPYLNAQSHVLIHHMITYGKILTTAEWVRFFTENGCTHVKTAPTNFLGFELLLFKI